MKIKYLLLFSSFLGLMACSESKGTKSNSAEINLDAAIEHAESRRETDPNASGGNKCLLDYQTKYDQLLGEQDILAATGFSKDVMEIKYNKAMKNPEYHDIRYKFKNKRIGTLRGLDMKMEIPDDVKISGIKAMSFQHFEESYRAVSEEEMQVAKDVLNDVADGKSGDAEAEAALKKAEAHNVSKKQVKKVGSIMMDAMKEVSKGYRVVENLGDAARWNIVTNELVVLQNGVQFVIFSEVNNDKEKNKSVAIDVAKNILNKCR
jgi:hypothetical protein